MKTIELSQYILKNFAMKGEVLCHFKHAALHVLLSQPWTIEV